MEEIAFLKLLKFQVPPVLKGAAIVKGATVSQVSIALNGGIFGAFVIEILTDVSNTQPFDPVVDKMVK